MSIKSELELLKKDPPYTFEVNEKGIFPKYEIYHIDDLITSYYSKKKMLKYLKLLNNSYYTAYLSYSLLHNGE